MAQHSADLSGARKVPFRSSRVRILKKNTRIYLQDLCPPVTAPLLFNVESREKGETPMRSIPLARLAVAATSILLAASIGLTVMGSTGPIPLNCNRACLENVIDQ